MIRLSPYEFIARKQDGEEYTREELIAYLSQYMAGEVQDYQMTAWMMAIYFRGMTERETAWLTEAMLETGSRLSFPNLGLPLADKHSTGGVGDKITLLLAPLLAATGVAIPTIAGRGLGYTGGTLDKLESIPGFRTSLSVEEIQRRIQESGIAFASQTAELAPADRRMYSLRDVTGTIRSLPLITSSIVSKKAAEGIEGIVYDVKCGRGAFMHEEADAFELASWLVRVSSRFGLRAAALVTSMDAPLGRGVGNWLEVTESVRALRGKAIEPDIRELTLALGGTLLCLCDVAQTPADGWKKMDMAWASGDGYKKWIEAVKGQGGDPSVFDDGADPHPAAASLEITAEQPGYIHSIDAKEIGFAGVDLKAGRQVAEDGIDPSAGFIFHRQVGDQVHPGEPILTMYGKSNALLERVGKRVHAAIRIEDIPAEAKPLIRGVVTLAGRLSWDTFRTTRLSQLTR